MKKNPEVLIRELPKPLQDIVRLWPMPLMSRIAYNEDESSVALEWQVEDVWFELEMGDDGDVEVMAIKEGEKPRHWTIKS